MAHLPPMAQIRRMDIQSAQHFLRELPSLNLDQLPADEYCPICFVSFNTIAREELRSKNEAADCRNQTLDEQDVHEEFVGIVKLGCGHVFCRKDVSEWIESCHGSCPTCRHVFFQFTPIDETDYESSDGGEYIPEDDDDDELEDEEDAYTEDGIPSSDADFPISEYLEQDLDLVEMEDEDERNLSISTNGGLTDGSDSLSEEGAYLGSDGVEDDYAGDVSMVSELDDDDDDDLPDPNAAAQKSPNSEAVERGGLSLV